MVTRSHTSLTLFRLNRLLCIQIVERKNTSNSQLDDGEACFDSGDISMPASIPLEPGGSSARRHHDWPPSEPAGAFVPVS